MMQRTDPHNINLPHMLMTLSTLLLDNRNASRAQIAEAESLLLQARPLFAEHYAPDHVAVLQLESKFGLIAAARGDFARAEKIEEATLARLQPEEQRSSYLVAEVELAEDKFALGQAVAAEKLLQEAAEQCDQLAANENYARQMILKKIGEVRALMGETLAARPSAEVSPP